MEGIGVRDRLVWGIAMIVRSRLKTHNIGGPERTTQLIQLPTGLPTMVSWRTGSSEILPSNLRTEVSPGCRETVDMRNAPSNLCPVGQKRTSAARPSSHRGGFPRRPPHGEAEYEFSHSSWETTGSDELVPSRPMHRSPGSRIPSNQGPVFHVRDCTECSRRHAPTSPHTHSQR